MKSSSTLILVGLVIIMIGLFLIFTAPSEGSEFDRHASTTDTVAPVMSVKKSFTHTSGVNPNEYLVSCPEGDKVIGASYIVGSKYQVNDFVTDDKSVILSVQEKSPIVNGKIGIRVIVFCTR